MNSPKSASEVAEQAAKPNCPLETGLIPCMCKYIPRCPVCNYSDHDARFHNDHHLCDGVIPQTGEPNAE